MCWPYYYNGDGRKEDSEESDKFLSDNDFLREALDEIFGAISEEIDDFPYTRRSVEARVCEKLDELKNQRRDLTGKITSFQKSIMIFEQDIEAELDEVRNIEKYRLISETFGELSDLYYRRLEEVLVEHGD